MPPPLPENGLSRPDSGTALSTYDANDDEGCSEDDERAIVERTEEPGLDSLRGTFGAFGTMIRARRRATALSEARQRAASVVGRGSGVSGGRGDRENSLSMSVASAKQELEKADANGDTEKVEMAKRVFGNGRTLKSSMTSNEAFVLRQPPALTRPNTSPGPVNVLGEDMASSPTSTPSFPDLRRASSLHAHFDSNDDVERPPLTFPTAVPSAERKRDDQEGEL